MNEKIIGRLMYEDIHFKCFVDFGYIIPYNQNPFEDDEIVWEIDFPDSARPYYCIYTNHTLVYKTKTISDTDLDLIIGYIKAVEE